MKDEKGQFCWEHFKGHFFTITHHKMVVMKHCMKAGIPLQGLLHDLSKYSFEEFIPGVLYYQGTRSPNEGEREVYGYSKAWMHHKGRNKHHFEYWSDYDPVTKQNVPVRMPIRFVIEMFCDRVAASKIYRKDQYTDKDPLAYFENGMKKRVGRIHPKTSDLLEKLLRMLAEEGEDKTFAYIRSLKR